MEESIKIGVSACLLGEQVRYDGGHKRDPYIVETLGQYLEFHPVCPESEAGLGIPRESMRLVGDPENPRLTTVKTGRDMTELMTLWSRQKVRELEQTELCGFIFMSRSPSSGMERVKVYNDKKVPEKKGVGLFARAFMEHFPLLPVEEDGRLHDPVLRENFIERIFAMKRWRDFLAGEKRPGDLVEFHTCHKLQIMCHSVTNYREMGRLTANMHGHDPGMLHIEYERLLMGSLKQRATRAKHCNVMQHILGYFKTQLSRDEKEEAGEILALYKTGHLPLIVPITLLNHFVRKYDEKYLKKQYYLRPHPIELNLRNHV